MRPDLKDRQARYLPLPDRVWIDGGVWDTWRASEADCLSPHGPFVRADLIPALIAEAVEAEQERMALNISRARKEQIDRQLLVRWCREGQVIDERGKFHTAEQWAERLRHQGEGDSTDG